MSLTPPPRNYTSCNVGHIPRATRERLTGQRALTLWMTGLSASGKSTTAFALEACLIDQGRLCVVLDGDNLRHGINRNLGFSPEDRRENIRRVAEIARLMNDAGLIVIVSLISPLQVDRDMARAIIGADRFLEILISAPLAVCENRDPKHLYAKARAGEIPDFTGISAPYEIPHAPDCILETTSLTPNEAAIRLATLIQSRQKG
ncbi:MAG: adenylyl-sulfate kinase [Zoogloeaceae bacterium]|nr:adenylyl-sulfate kinase [Zoogloeaceae bacterium]